MAFAVAGQLALDRTEFFQVIKSHSVEAVLSPQGVDAVFGVSGIVHKVIGLVPCPPFFGKHHAMDRRHNFCQGRWSPPMTRGPADHSMGVHQGDQSPSHRRIGQHHFLAGSIADLDGIFGSLLGGSREAVGDVEGAQRRCLDGLDRSYFSGHG